MKSLSLLLVVLVVGLFAVGCEKSTAPTGGDAPYTAPDSDVTSPDVTPDTDAPAETAPVEEPAEVTPAPDAPAVEAPAEPVPTEETSAPMPE